MRSGLNSETLRRKAPVFASAILVVALACAGLRASNQSNSAQMNATSAPLADATGIFFLRKGDIWSANVDGSEQKQITHSGQIDEYFW